MSQQGLLQQSIRDITGTALDYNGDWLALMADDGVTTGTFDERLLSWINVTLGTSYTNLPEAQQAFAVDQGYTSWSHMGAIVLAQSLAKDLFGSETQGLALDFTDDFWEADTGHYGSAYIVDTGTPANDYDSHPYGLLTYTSPSAKMTLGPSGTLRFGAHNLGLRSEDFTNATWAKLNCSAPAADSLIPTATSSVYHGAQQSIAYVAGASYALTIEAKPNGYNRVAIYEDTITGWYTIFDVSTGTVITNAAGAVGSMTALADGWYRCTLTVTAAGTGVTYIMPRQNTDTTLAAYSGDTTSGVFVRKFQVRRTPSDSTYLATTSAARYALPYEWDSSGNNLGILVEEARTNICLRSQEFDNTTAWANVGGVLTRTANAISGPDGTTTADLLDQTASGYYINQTITTVGSTAYTYSVRVKPHTNTTRFFLYLGSGGVGGSDGGVRFNATTGAFIATVGTAVTSYSSEVLSDGWLLLSVTATAGDTTSDFIIQATTDANALTSCQYYAWGAQVEAGSFATSYIPTLGSTVTRAADSGLTLATSAFPHSATVNSAMIRYRPLGVANAMVALRWDDGTSNEVVSVGHDASANIGLTVTDGGAAQTAPLTSGTATANAWEKIAVSWKANDFLLSDNGATAAADTSGTLPTVTSLDIGPTLSGHISQILVLPVEKSAAEVEAMAT